jgi:hypothetical protein
MKEVMNLWMNKGLMMNKWVSWWIDELFDEWMIELINEWIDE